MWNASHHYITGTSPTQSGISKQDLPVKRPWFQGQEPPASFKSMLYWTSSQTTSQTISYIRKCFPTVTYLIKGTWFEPFFSFLPFSGGLSPKPMPTLLLNGELALLDHTGAGEFEFLDWQREESIFVSQELLFTGDLHLSANPFLAISSPISSSPHSASATMVPSWYMALILVFISFSKIKLCRNLLAWKKEKEGKVQKSLWNSLLCKFYNQGCGVHAAFAIVQIYLTGAESSIFLFLEIKFTASEKPGKCMGCAQLKSQKL